MGRDLEEHARQEAERRLRLGDRVKLGAALALTGVAVLLLGTTSPQDGWVAFLTFLFGLVGVAMVLGGVVLAGRALWELLRPPL